VEGLANRFPDAQAKPYDSAVGIVLDLAAVRHTTISIENLPSKRPK
jgi:hypothetical protein